LRRLSTLKVPAHPTISRLHDLGFVAQTYDSIVIVQHNRSRFTSSTHPSAAADSSDTGSEIQQIKQTLGELKEVRQIRLLFHPRHPLCAHSRLSSSVTNVYLAEGGTVLQHKRRISYLSYPAIPSAYHHDQTPPDHQPSPPDVSETLQVLTAFTFASFCHYTVPIHPAKLRLRLDEVS